MILPAGGLSEIENIRAFIDVSRETEERLVLYVDLLKRWQAKINLIAPSTLVDVWQRHVADSAQILLVVPEARSFIDMGSGAGFPGLVVAILLAEEEGARVDMIESNGKKCSFLNAVIRETGLKETQLQVEVHNHRVEDIMSSLPCPDVVTARALAPLDQLIELSKHHLGGGAVGLFPKGRGHNEEITNAAKGSHFDYEIHSSRFDPESVIVEAQGFPG